MVPDFQSLMKPTLRLISEGDSSSLSHIIIALGKRLRLTDQQLAEPTRGGFRPAFESNARWAVTYLWRAGLIQRVGRGQYAATADGVSYLVNADEAFKIRVLRKLPAYQAYLAASSASEADAAVADTDGVQSKTPTELLFDAFDGIRNSVVDDLVARIQEQEYIVLESICLDILERLNYGKGRLTPKGGDKGVDGVIDQDELGLDKVYVQAKRYKNDNKVGGPEMDKFIGALDKKKAQKGVFITTSDFTDDAKEAASQCSKRIVLINGKRLGEIMYDHGVGVIDEGRPLHIRRLDDGYFNAPS